MHATYMLDVRMYMYVVRGICTVWYTSQGSSGMHNAQEARPLVETWLYSKLIHVRTCDLQNLLEARSRDDGCKL